MKRLLLFLLCTCALGSRGVDASDTTIDTDLVPLLSQKSAIFRVTWESETATVLGVYPDDEHLNQAKFVHLVCNSDMETYLKAFNLHGQPDSYPFSTIETSSNVLVRRYAEVSANEPPAELVCFQDRVRSTPSSANRVDHVIFTDTASAMVTNYVRVRPSGDYYAIACEEVLSQLTRHGRDNANVEHITGNSRLHFAGKERKAIPCTGIKFDTVKDLCNGSTEMKFLLKRATNKENCQQISEELMRPQFKKLDLSYDHTLAIFTNLSDLMFLAASLPNIREIDLRGQTQFTGLTARIKEVFPELKVLRLSGGNGGDLSFLSAWKLNKEFTVFVDPSVFDNAAVKCPFLSAENASIREACMRSSSFFRECIAATETFAPTVNAVLDDLCAVELNKMMPWTMDSWQYPDWCASADRKVRCEGATRQLLAPENAQTVYKLELAHRGIRALKPLEGLPTLRELHLPNNLLSSAELEKLASLPLLEFLDVSNNPLASLAFVTKLSLKGLVANNVSLQHVNELSLMSPPRKEDVTLLAIANNPIQSLQPVTELKNLNYLDVSKIPALGSPAGAGMLTALKSLSMLIADGAELASSVIDVWKSVGFEQLIYGSFADTKAVKSLSAIRPVTKAKWVGINVANAGITSLSHANPSAATNTEGYSPEQVIKLGEIEYRTPTFILNGNAIPRQPDTCPRDHAFLSIREYCN